MERGRHNKDPYRHSWGYGSTTPFTESVVFRDDYRPVVKEPVIKERGLLERILMCL